MVNSWVNGKMSNHFARQPKYYLTNYNFLKPSYLLLRVVIDSNLRNYWPGVLQPTGLVKSPLADFDCGLYTDTSSFTENGQRRARYAVVSISKVIEARVPSAGTSAQKAELIPLTRASLLSQGKRVNIYTNSNYVFMVVHAHGQYGKKRTLKEKRTLSTQ